MNSTAWVAVVLTFCLGMKMADFFIRSFIVGDERVVSFKCIFMEMVVAASYGEWQQLIRTAKLKATGRYFFII